MNVTIKKIAELADVSRGTVDRVIHGRPGVRDDVRARVNSILETLDYKPNLAGKALVNTNKNIKIGVVLAPDFNPFVEEVKRGIENEAQRIGAYGVELDVEVINILDENEQLEILNKLQENNVSAIAVVPIESQVIRVKINELIDSGIPVVTFNSDIADTGRLCFVGQDNYKAGLTVGGLTLKLLQKPASVGIITSTVSLTCHKRRIEGFKDKVAESSAVTISAVEQNNDIDEQAFDIAIDFIRNIENLKLIYITGGGVAGVGKALRVMGKAGEIKVISHDLIPDSIELLKQNVVDFVIGQDPYLQGMLPVKILFDYIFLKEKPEDEVFFTGVDIFTRENID